MKTCKSILVLLAVLAFASTATAQVHGASIGVYFDESATMNTIVDSGILTGYVFVKNAETTVTGAAFRMYFASGITKLGMQFPDQALPIDTAEGLWIGLHTPRGCFGEEIVELCRFDFMVGTQLLSDAQISIVDHLSPNDAGIHICDQNYNLIEVTGEPGYVSVLTSTESSSWGDVKSLYR